MANGRKTGGRRKGTPNKSKQGFRDDLRAYCAELGVDPHRFMADMLANPAIDQVALKLAAARELAQYLEPKLKAIELSGDPDRPVEHRHEVTLEEIAAHAYPDPPPPAD